MRQVKVEAAWKLRWEVRGSEKSMLYHSAARSTGLGGMTRLGFSRTSRTCLVGEQSER